LRAAATDLNFTLALALVAMFMVQYYGFKYLGPKYLGKFFTFSIDEMAKNPIKLMDPAVGLLELVGEIARIISFSFRLLGNIFAGQVLLFVIAFLIPVANVVFYGLEFFVGLIQAAVFALLAIIFMTGATESHGDHDEQH
jgi:F-type H+-transporting ATPase subunit a